MTSRHIPLALAAATLLAGCDPKAGDSYEGESLLGFQGSVLLANSSLQGALRPALAFVPAHGRMLLLDVSVQGSFPANFELDVLEPPPAEALISANRYILEAPPGKRLAMAYITAVGSDHPSEIRMAEGGGFKYDCEGGVTRNMLSEVERSGNALFWDWEDKIQVMRASHRGEPGASCTEEIAGLSTDWEIGEDTILYRRVSQCDYQFQSCETIVAEGDPKYLSNPFSMIAGLSTNYLVVFLEEAADAATPIARAFGGEALSAGYHLLSATPENEFLDPGYDDCASSINPIELYNAKHGTQFVNQEEIAMALFPNPPSDTDAAMRKESWQALRALEEELYELRGAASAENCSAFQPVLGRQVAPGSHGISIEIASEVYPTLILSPAQH